MNQILANKEKENLSSEKNTISTIKNKRSILQVYTVQFYFSLVLFLSFLILFLCIRFYHQRKENYSDILLGKYQVSTLYARPEEESQKTLLLGENVQEKKSPFVIGIIQIESIKLNYPILSESTDELLNISPCRFAGPMPNEVGNLCIAGHNYADNRFFGRIDELKQGDLIEIFDLSGHKEDYYVSSTARIRSTDTSCTNQNTNGEKIITLLTCNNLSTTRLAVRGIQK